MSETTDKRIALVTGASRGIGQAVAMELARAGHHVVAVARTEGGLTDLDDAIRAIGGTTTLVPMSLTDTDAIDRLGAALFERYGRLDVLVANAGMLGPLSPVGHVKPKAFDEVMAVNVTANFRLIRSLDPLLRRSAAARTLFVSAGTAHKCRPYWGPYSVSKAALEALVRTYAAEVESFGITANLLSPGPLRTRMRAEAMPGEDPMTLKTPEDLAPYVVAAVSVAETRTGLIYDFPSLSWTEPQAPRPV
ncbi:SDR family NAD(P)-dependent oxidoreductase [Mongoliimonas terrestris]|uniref:SDR family NAD(P)-dependent oxidoreductase n=1 Tax=Mongoliimonas terrestris TaxID=1709001 RepID=UPI000949686D|nr:SDR family NAD(P)-dependent oxidoreductase [Mongoliimonas terrestris]